MVSLQKHLRQEFNSGARARGEELFRYGGVRHLTGDALSASASVTGNGTYRVDAERVGHDLLTSCACPYFLDNGYCKHLWAFLLEAEKAGLLGGLDSSSPRFMLELSEELEALGANGESSTASPRANWRSLLLQLHSHNSFSPPVAPPETWPAGRELYFVITQAAGADKGIPVELLYSDPLKKGGLSKPKDARISRDAVATIADQELRELLQAIAGVPDLYSSNSEKLQGTYFLRGRIAQTYLERMCRTGRCYLRAASNVAQDQWTRLQWDDGEPWRLALRMDHDTAEHLWRVSGILERVSGILERTGETQALSVPVMLSKHGVLISEGKIARFDANGGHAWAEILKREGGEVIVPDAQASDFAFEVAKTGTSPLKLPEELAYQEVRKPPIPCLKIESTQRYQGRRSVGALRFLYGTKLIDPADREDSFPDVQNRQIIHRDRRVEAMALTTLYGLGLRTGPWYGSGSGQWDLTQQDVLRVVPELASMGWRVEAEGIRYRSASNFEATVQSGIDWFELNASVDYEGVRVELPRLLRAVANGSRAITLANGEYGLIPEEILERYKLLVGLGKTEGGAIRFNKNQAGLLDVLLAERPEVKVDEIFAAARLRLRSFGGVQAAKQPAGFAGTLRHYQLEGLGWMQFLDEFALGGCLADDMGVGKTPQVLALLETRRGKTEKPALIVVPRSLVYNWKQEAARFTPSLRVLDHSAPDRNRKTPDFASYDAVLTTYGTIRNDALLFRKMSSSITSILDEAQAIKNPASESAKAARLLNGRHRLVLSGTPVENHLGELWSLFEFLNPGMLGAVRRIQARGRSAKSGRRDPRAAGARGTSLHSAPHEGTGGAGASAQDGADDLLRPGTSAAASYTTNCATTIAPSCWRKVNEQGLGKIEDSGAGGAAAVAAGGVPSGVARCEAQ